MDHQALDTSVFTDTIERRLLAFLEKTVETLEMNENERPLNGQLPVKYIQQMDFHGDSLFKHSLEDIIRNIKRKRLLERVLKKKFLLIQIHFVFLMVRITSKFTHSIG